MARKARPDQGRNGVGSDIDRDSIGSVAHILRCLALLSSSSRSRRHLKGEISYSDQVEDRHAEGEHPVDQRSPSVARLAQRADGLQPTKYLFDSFASSLADCVAFMPSCPSIDRTASPCIVFTCGNVWRDVPRAKFRDKVARIVTLVRTERDRLGSRYRLDHFERSFAFGFSARNGQTYINGKSRAVLHQRVAHVHKPSLTRKALAKEPGLRIGG